MLRLLYLIAHWIWIRIVGRAILTFTNGSSSAVAARSAKIAPTPFKPDHASNSEADQLSSRLYVRLGPIAVNQIRLLVLYSGSADEPLRGHLRTEEFDASQRDQKYEALSYVWGHQERRRSIILNTKPFYITEVLHRALHFLRSENVYRTLWIDAMCIDQSNKTERNEQVSIMGEIYQCARRVVNWLGEESAETRIGMKALSYLFGDEDIIATPPSQKFSPKELCAGLNDILTRDYFGRMWVVQENALAAKITIQVGDQTLAWSRGFETYRAVCRIKFTAISPAWDAAGLRKVDFRPLLEVLEQNMMVTRRELGKSCREVTPLDQAFDMRHRKASDPRDMIFALRAMAPDHIKERIIVDYEKPVDELYADFFEEVKKVYAEEVQFIAECKKESIRNASRGGW